LLRGSAKNLADAGVVVVPSLGVPATFDHAHETQYALDAAVGDVVDTVVQDVQGNREQDGRSEIHLETSLSPADGAGANARIAADVFLAAPALASVAQFAGDESIGYQYAGCQHDLLEDGTGAHRLSTVTPLFYHKIA